ncbi:MAG: glutaredoxin family protein [Aquabacterium sp.]
MYLAHRRPHSLLPWAAAALLMLAGPAWALYKVVGPDGKVTYTDRPPTAQANIPVSTVSGASGGDGANLTGVPFDVRQAAQRFPVQLYTTSDCSPCSSARQYLNRRGVPFVEFTVNGDADQVSFRQQFKVDALPLLRVGGKNMTGFNEQEWRSYLDAAGYPASSQLPSTYRQADARPWRPASRPGAATAESSRADTPPAAPPVKPPPGIRF